MVLENMFTNTRVAKETFENLGLWSYIKTCAKAV